MSTFSLEAESRSFWVCRDHESLGFGQEVKVTEEGESCYFVSDYGWLEKEYLSGNPVSTADPVISGEPVQHAVSGTERILSFTVSDDVNVKEVVVSGKTYPVNEREKEMHIMVSEYGEHLVIANDVEGNSARALFTLSAPPENETEGGKIWYWLIPIVIILPLILFLAAKSSRKKTRKIRL
jgi:hypothetical protein